MVIILTTLATDSHYQQRRRPLLRLILILSLGGIAIATHSQHHERDLLQMQRILNKQPIKNPPIGGLSVIQLSRIVINADR